MGGTQHLAAKSYRPHEITEFERTKLYREQGIVWVTPTRGMIPAAVVVSWLSMQWPMNHPRTTNIVLQGMEVGEAYNKLFQFAMTPSDLEQAYDPESAAALARSPFVLTTEEDNIIPGDAVPKLIQSIYACPDCGGEVGGEAWECSQGHHGFDAVSGLYFLKSSPMIPMAYGHPTDEAEANFYPRSIEQPMKDEATIEVYGIAMGCALWRKDLFRRVSSPWFVTEPGFTQDLWFCKKAHVETTARFGVHCGVRVGHMTSTGEIF